MPNVSHCAKCGAPLPPNWPKGLCSRCELQGALELSNAESQVLQPDSPQGPGRTILLSEADLVMDRTGVMIGRYKLLQKIGEGGFGTVYMAEQQEPVQRKVALKIIKAGMDTREVIARFEAERQAIALMDHSNIARVLDAGATEAGRPYFVMELVRGIPITDFCDQGHLPAADRLKLFMTVCHAVQHAHQKGVIHRDLKPSNVLVTLHDGQPVPKVIDFGVAKALGQKLTDKTLFTAFHHMIGTPAYMSPEQAALSGLDIDTRADIYSLGVLLYELLTGVTPFDAETFRKAALDEIRRMIRETEPLKPSTRLQTLGDKLIEVAKHRQTEPAALSRLVRGDLDWIVMKCLEKDRTRRYETANGLAMDIQRHLQNETVVARPPSNLYRLQKMVRRNKLAFAAVTTVLVSTVAGLVLFAWQWQQAEAKSRQLAIAVAENELIAHAVSISGLVSMIIVDPEVKISFAQGDRVSGPYENPSGLRLRWDPYDNEFQPKKKNSATNSTFGTCSHRSANGKFVAFGYSDGTAVIGNAETSHILVPPLLHPLAVNAVRFSPASTTLATGSSDGAVRIWDVRAGRLSIGPLTADGAAVVGLRFTEDSQHIVALTATNTLAVWSASTGQLRSRRVVKITRPEIHFSR